MPLLNQSQVEAHLTGCMDADYLRVTRHLVQERLGMLKAQGAFKSVMERPQVFHQPGAMAEAFAGASAGEQEANRNLQEAAGRTHSAGQPGFTGGSPEPR
jgi:hypothetical protein